MLRPLTFFYLTLLIFSSCVAAQGRSEKFREAVFYLNEGVRWGRLQEVLSRIDPKSEEHFLEMHKEFGKKIQISSCEVVNTKLDLKNGVAKVGVKIIWYRIDEMVVHDTTLLQHWKEQDHQWLLVAEEYRSGTPF